MKHDINDTEFFEFGSDSELRRKGELAFKRTFKALHHVSPKVSELAEVDLKEIRRELEDTMMALLDRCESEKRNLSDTEQWGYKYSEFLLECYNSEFDKRKGVTPKVRHFADPSHVIAYPDGRREVIPDINKPVVNSKSYRGLFFGSESAGLDDGGFRSINEFFAAIANAPRMHDPRLDVAAKRTQQLTIGAEGGFSAPSFHGGWLLDKSLPSEIMRNLAMVVPLRGAENKYVAWDNQDQSNSLYGGFVGLWLAEGEEADIETGKIRSVNFFPRKLGIYAEATREILSEGIDFQNQLTSALVRSISYLLDEAFVSGSGIGRPQGLIHSPSRIDVTRSVANQINWADLYTMYEKLHPSAENAVWLASSSTLSQLVTLKDSSNNLIFMPASFTGISAPLPGSIFGKKLIFTDKLATLGNRADLVLCDPSVGYIIGLREDIIVQSSNAPGFMRDVETFRVLLRADGASTFSKPFTMRDGTQTSWCVCLN